MAGRRDSDALNDARRALGVRPGGLPPPRLFIERPSVPDLPPSPTLRAPSSPQARAPPSPRSPLGPRHVSIPIPGGVGIRSGSGSEGRAGLSIDMDALPPPSPTSEHPKRFRRPTISSKNRTPRQTSNRGLYETQKLLLYLLDKLENRDNAPDILERASIAAREVSGKSRNKGKGKVQRLGHAIAAAAQNAGGPSSTSFGIRSGSGSAGPSTGAILTTIGDGVGSEDYEDKLVLDEGDFDTEGIFDLVEQTRGLLVLAEKQGLELFKDDGGSLSEGHHVPILHPSPIKNRRKTGRFSSVAGPLGGIKPSFSFPHSDHQQSQATDEDTPRPSTSNAVSGPALLARVMAVLQTLLTVDCLHRTHLFRPLCPRNALQSACLDIAAYLYKKCGTATKIEIVGMVVDGLYGMGTMMAIACEWVEGRMEELLRILAKERGGPRSGKDGEQAGDPENVGWTDPFSTKSAPGKAVPTFAISTDSQDTLPAPPNSSGWMRYSPISPSFPFFPPSNIAGLLSTLASREASDNTIQIAALVPRILLAITSIIDLSSSKLTMIHRVHRLLSLILTAKPDSALDLLEIVAHAPPTPRRTALEILSTFFPGVLGHNSIARRLANTTYTAQRTKWEMGQERVLGEDEVDGHVFIPWRISSKESTSAPSSAAECSVCNTDLHGFVIRCSLCGESRHLHCYHSPGGVFQYDVITLSSRNSAPQMTHVKFSQSLARLDEKVLYGATPRGGPHNTARRVGQHELVLMNLFNLALCNECRLPLWGTADQAYGCTSGCQRFFHPACLDGLAHSERGQCRYGRDVVIDEISAQGSNPFTIALSDLHSSFEKQCKALCIPARDLGSKTYDEIAVLYGMLWIQYQILKNGLSSSSFRITETTSKKADQDVLGLKAILKGYEENLRTRAHEASSAASDYAHISSLEQPLGQGYLFSEQYLTYVTALLRAPSGAAAGGSTPGSHPQTPSDGFLTPLGLPAPPGGEGDNEGAYEILPLSIISSSLSSDLGIRDQIIVSAFINQLRLIGLLQISDILTVRPKHITSPDHWGSFALPLLMDSSPTVELLISSVEVLLTDLDLTMNEQGLRLLVNRAWPSLLCSPYALERLAKGVIAWVMAEDEALLQIVKLYASRHRRLPGLRATAGSGTLKGESSVNVYKDDRGRLLSRYVEPWLSALHDQDPGLYAGIIYEECKNAAASSVSGEVESVDETDAQVASCMAGVALERMTAMVDAGVIFSTLMGLLTAWLEDLGALADQDVIYRSLPRLLRHSPTSAASADPPEQSDIFTLSLSVSQAGPEGLTRVCRWMRVLSFSGVEVPWTLLIDLVELQSQARSETEARLDLVIAVGANGVHIDPEGFARMCDRMGKGVFKESGRAGGEELAQIELELVKQTMLLILRSYGVTVDDIARTALNTGELHTKQPASLAKKRRVTLTRSSFSLDSEMILSAASLLERTSVQPALVLDFIWLLFTSAAMVDNVDGFIHLTCPKLFALIWPLVDYPIDRESRARVLLKMLSVNPNPLERIVRKQLDSSTDGRAQVRERLLTFILELADEGVTSELHTWRSSAVGLILLLFDAILDTAEMIPDNLVILGSLLPTQLRAMSACFEEFLVQSSDERRLVLLTRLKKLRLAIPAWPIVSWTIIEGLLAEEVANISSLRPGRSSQTMSALMDSQSVRCSLISLGLDMLAHGVPITWNAAQRFQQHVASCLSLPWANPTDTITALVLPSVRSILDSSARIVVSGQSFESKTKRTTLVGALFIPVVVDLGEALEKHDFLTQRTLLDIMMVTFFKQNVRPVELAALSALQNLAQFVLTTECSENRLLALQILQTAVVRMERDSVVRAVPSMFATVAAVLVKENEAEPPDGQILEQSRVFLRSIVKSFGRSGLFLQLFRVQENPDPASDGSSTIGKALQILHASEKQLVGSGQPNLFDDVFSNLSDVLKRGKQILDQVLISLARFANSLKVELSEDAAQNFGVFIIRLGKHVAEADAHEFDANPILQTCAAMLDLVQPSASTMLLHQTATVLHLSLTRFNVGRETLIRLLDVSERIARAQGTEDTVRTVTFELAGSAVHGLNVTPVTLNTLLSFLAFEAFVDDTKVSQRGRVLADSAPGCVQILIRTHPTFASLNHGQSSVDPEVVLGLMVKAGTVLCKAEISVQGIISQSLGSLTSEAASTQVNLFVFTLLASLDTPMGAARARLLALYPILSRATSLCLRASADFLTLQDTTGDGAELLSLVFAVFRLSVLALTDYPPTQGGKGMEEDAMDTLWCRIWPDWYRLLTLSLDSTCINGPLRAVAHSVFLDTIIFLGTTNSPILTQHAGTLSRTLSILVRHQESTPNHHAGSTGSSKMQKAAQILDRLASGGSGGGWRVDRAKFVSSVRKDLGATERLRALRSM